MAVCVKPLHFEFDKSVWFVEFIEMYRIQGATHFFFYDHSVSQNVSKILSHYVRSNLATVLPGQIGGPGFVPVADGVAHPRPLERRTWYRHTVDWLLVKP